MNKAIIQLAYIYYFNTVYNEVLPTFTTAHYAEVRFIVQYEAFPQTLLKFSSELLKVHNDSNYTNVAKIMYRSQSTGFDLTNASKNIKK